MNLYCEIILIDLQQSGSHSQIRTVNENQDRKISQELKSIWNIKPIFKKSSLNSPDYHSEEIN